MTSAPSKDQPRPGQSAVGATPASSASMLLEKKHPGMRRSTPDSEALASSDDELEHQLAQSQHVQPMPLTKPTRRTSWLNEVPPSLQRKASLTASVANSNPPTPAVDQSTWAASTSPSLGGSAWGSSSGNTTFPWSTGIWDSRKEPPARLTEVLQSPTSLNGPGSSMAEEILSPTARMPSGESSIPFAIPLHPTPKTYRSQSYSVGQLDPELMNMPSSMPPVPVAGAARAPRGTGQYSALQHRPSRPSLLGELGHDPATLGRVREDDMDEGSENESDGGQNWASNQARTIEQLTKENAMLRQAADNSRFRDRAASVSNPGYPMVLPRTRGRGPEQADLAVEDLDELGDIPGYASSRRDARRRFSEHSANLERQFPTFASLENRNLENVKRAHWQTSLGFGGIAEAPQSRRHSFADIPTRHASVSSSGDSQATVSGLSPRPPNLGDREPDGFVTTPDGTLQVTQGENPSYFSGLESARRAVAEGIISPAMAANLHRTNVPPGAYGRPLSNLAVSHDTPLLFIVTFKCCRSEVFYIPEDTGLEVKPGDLVIVEADRGTDLGTVAHANVSWADAKELKKHYAEQHYRWLMMFSRQGQNGTTSINPNGATSNLTGAPGSAVGGMGPQGQHSQESSTELKPKMIKRLAQNHEIQTLREKEGNEAKAKRVCQQKVVEHRLNMEILDAEFQVDWKKLTFYYFADTYINFNPLVTDLFKIYKTRIWMSAINPASFATPSAGLQPPTTGAMPYAPDGSERRRQHVGQSPFDQADSRRDGHGGALRNPFMEPYQQFGQPPRQPALGLGGVNSSPRPQADPFSSYPSTSYMMEEPNGHDYATPPGAPGLGAVGRTHPTHGDWMSRFQGLSLGS